LTGGRRAVILRSLASESGQRPHPERTRGRRDRETGKEEGVMKTTTRLLGALVLAFLGSAAWAQVSTGGLTVRVRDASDKSLLPGAQVTLTNDIRAIAPATVVTDAKGEAAFPILPAKGLYTIEVFFSGYQRTRLPNVRIKPNETQYIEVQLLPEKEEVVQVVGERVPTVELEKTTTSTRFSDEFLQDLPVQGRFYQQMLTFAPGVQDADGDGNPNVHGSRERDFKAVVSGLSNQDPLTGLSMGLVNMDSIEEIEVITAGAGAEYSRAQGGFAKIIQKQGTNDFEGVGNFLFRSDKLDGNGALNVPKSQLPEFSWFQPSVQVSGPIVKDKLWYRLSHEYISVDLPTGVVAGVAVQKFRQQIHDDLVTWQASPRNKLSLQFRYDPSEFSNLGVSSSVPSSSTPTREYGGSTYSITWSAPYSPKLYVESQVAYQNYELNLIPTTRGVKNNCISGVPALEDARCFDARFGLFSGSWPFDWRDKRQRFTAQNSGTFYAGRFWGMTHTIRFGFTAENERYFRSLEERPAATFFVFSRVNDRPGGEQTIDQVGLVLASFPLQKLSRMRAAGTTVGLYAEDEVKPRSNLTIKVGARVDREYINSNGWTPFDPSSEAQFFMANRTGNADEDGQLLRRAFTAFEGLEGEGGISEQFQSVFGFPITLDPAATWTTSWLRTRRPGNISIVNTNFAPRFAIAWDPWSNGKTKVSATAGRYFDKLFLSIPTIELEPLRIGVEFDARQVGSQWVVLPRTDPVNPASTADLVDRNLRTPYNDEFTLAFERELPLPETAITIRYIQRNYKKQLQDIDLNHLPGDFGRCILQRGPTDPFLVPSEGEGSVLTDPFTGETYVDTDPGIGDGRFDDCTGKLETLQGSGEGGGGLIGRKALVVRPDGIPDLYVQNPAWGDVFLVGNFNSARYKGIELVVNRRQYKNWQLEGSYTYSRALGDGEDFRQQLGDDRSTLEDERGYQSTDQRHVVKINATTQTPWGFRLGGAISWQSGLPFSILRQDLSYNLVPPFYGFGTPDRQTRTRYVTHRRNDQRNQSYWNFDVRFAKELNLPGGKNLQLTAEIFNLLNDGTLIVWNDFLGYGSQVNGRNDATQRFGRQYQVGFRLAF
jgi:hypothetical protein